MTKRFSRSSKTLLRNAIRHADVHNKYVEESDMWAVRNRELNYARKPNNSKPMRRAHMDRESRSNAVVDDRRSTYWARQLEKTEAADPDRWGHGGYKEMYPDEFDSERSSDESNSHGRNSSKTDQSKPSRKRRRSGDRDGRRKDKTVVTLYSSVHANKSDQRRSQKDQLSEDSKNSKHRKERTRRKRRMSESDSEQENMDSGKSSKNDGKSSKKSRGTASCEHSKHKKHGRSSRQKKTKSRLQEEDQKRRRTFKDSDTSSESD